jgi:hypothetical protein
VDRLLIGAGAELREGRDAVLDGRWQRLRRQPARVHRPAGARRRAQTPLFLQQTADANLRALALFDTLRIRAPELAVFVDGARRNVDALLWRGLSRAASLLGFRDPSDPV